MKESLIGELEKQLSSDRRRELFRSSISQFLYRLKYGFRWLLKVLWYTFFALLIVGIFLSKKDPLQSHSAAEAQAGQDAADIVLIMQATGLLNPN